MTSTDIARRREPSLDLVRLSQAWALAPIFRPLMRASDRDHLDVRVRVGQGEVMVVGRWALGIDDQDVLLALLRIAEHQERCPQIGPAPATPVGQSARDHLEADGLARAQTTIAIRTTLRELARTAGHVESGASLARVNESLRHLGQATVILNAGTARWTQAHVIGAARVDDGRVMVALHPDLAQALLGGKQAVTRIDMVAYRSLKSDAAKRLYVRLCGWLDAGRERRVRVDKLAEGVWMGEPSGPDMARARRRRTCLALTEIGALEGWTVRVEGTGGDTMAVLSRATLEVGPSPRRPTRKGRRGR